MENNLENLWRRINTWGVLIGSLGVLVSIIGLIIGFLDLSWIAFQIGIIILIVGLITWIFPYIHATLRMRNVNQFVKKILQEKEDKWFQGSEYFQTGKEFMINKNDTKALKYFDMAIDSGFKDEVYENRGMCLQALGFDLDAIEDFNKAISNANDDPNLYFLRALSKSSVGDIEGSVEDFRKAVELSKIPNEINNSYNLTIREKGYNSVTDFYKSFLLREEQTLEEAIKESNMSEEQKENIWGKANGERTYPHWKKVNKKRR